MEASFRQSMAWLHTWAGLVLGGLLFAIFWTGTLSVFDQEIDRWMMPETRIAPSTAPISLDALRSSYDDAAAQRASVWFVYLPSDRQPTLEVGYRTGSGLVLRRLDPNSGAALPDPETWAGTQFIYPFHFNLHLKIWRVGEWLVGLAAMMMLVLCISGVIIHRKIFVEFFTFRPRKQSRRFLLDLHNLAGVLGLPFHIAITLSGLVIAYTIYFPSGWQLVYSGSARTLGQEAGGGFSRSPLNRPGSLGSLDAMLAAARGLSPDDRPHLLVVHRPGDANAYVQINGAFDRQITRTTNMVFFDAASGDLLHRRGELRPAITVQRFIAGFHFAQFRHWTLRWLYFTLGLAGCILIATGFLFWLASRRRKHVRSDRIGIRVVEALTVGSVSGVVIATLMFLAANRLLPRGMSFLGYERAACEAWMFYLTWLATFVHAWLRPGPRAWVEQCRVAAFLAIAAVGLQWITTGDHLGRSLFHPHLWAIAGMDLLLLAGAAIAWRAGWRIQTATLPPMSAPQARHV